MLPRRRFLAAVALPAIAGCSEAPPEDTPTDTVADTESPTGRRTGTDDPDLREANVVEVAFDGEPGEDVRFDVTLFHDDDGEAGYANWWQVESPDGTRLGRRELLHAHSTAPFTRSSTMAVPADRRCVVVRGHDQTHEHGGRASLVNLESGAARYVDQGAMPQSFSPADCP